MLIDSTATTNAVLERDGKGKGSWSCGNLLLLLLVFKIQEIQSFQSRRFPAVRRWILVHRLQVMLFLSLTCSALLLQLSRSFLPPSFTVAMVCSRSLNPCGSIKHSTIGIHTAMTCLWTAVVCIRYTAYRAISYIRDGVLGVLRKRR